MSKYPVLYPSQSKGPQDIEKMHDLHLLNAYRRLVTGHDPDVRLRECMKQELDARGLDPQYHDGKPPQEAQS